MTNAGLETEFKSKQNQERIVLLILAAVQFTTIVDFMIVMPLGPQLMRTLDINPAQFGMVVSSYTFAAGAAGLIASAIADRFARRTTFMVLNAGFLLGTLLCALAPSYHTLVAARTLTGAFGGILGGMAMAIIGDVFPEQRRGRATGSLMTGFALASVVGVPFGLYLGTNYGWHLPFVVLAIGGLPALLLTPYALPPLNAHVSNSREHPLGSVVVGMTEDELPLVYIAGGALTLVASPIIGRLADRHGKLTVYRIVAPGSAVLMVAITHLTEVPVAIAIAVFGALMVCNVGRMIPAMAMVTSSVEPKRRGSFLSANSSVQHIGSGMGAYVGGVIVAESASGTILHFGTVGWIAAVSTILSLWLAGRLRIVDEEGVSAEKISLAAAAEAEVDAGEALVLEGN